MAARKHSELDLREKVALMRELGVIVHEGTTIGPEPPPKEVRDAMAREARKREKDPLFAIREHYSNLLGRIPSDEELKKHLP